MGSSITLKLMQKHWAKHYCQQMYFGAKVLGKD